MVRLFAVVHGEVNYCLPAGGRVKPRKGCRLSAISPLLAFPPQGGSSTTPETGAAEPDRKRHSAGRFF